MKSWSDMILQTTFNDRLRYLYIGGRIFTNKVEVDRYFSEKFYRSTEWRSVRRKVLSRDHFSDLAYIGAELEPKDITIHHINPITMEDILHNDPKLFDLENLISCSRKSHTIIHYGPLPQEWTERQPRDHFAW